MLAVEQLEQIFTHSERAREREWAGDSANLWAMLTPIPCWLKTRFDLMSRRRNKQISHDQRNEQIQLKQWSDRNERQMIFAPSETPWVLLWNCVHEPLWIMIIDFSKWYKWNHTERIHQNPHSNNCISAIKCSRLCEIHIWNSKRNWEQLGYT